MTDYLHNREMTIGEFQSFVDDLIADMKHGLPDLAKEAYAENGRGAIALHWHDAPVPGDRRMGTDYVDSKRIPDHRYLKQVVEESVKLSFPLKLVHSTWHWNDKGGF